ncbi:hypothetical protein [Methylovulum psychrotolerans]|uniref:hypothetical protein n=1 Tax=Methylovulum psychrotolerans TaxID=1704499 RepID=UPI0018DFA483|nr:hypothetical protein [Methylovulum psychrotolerans]
MIEWDLQTDMPEIEISPTCPSQILRYYLALRSNGLYPRLPRRASQVLSGSARRGAAGGQEAHSADPRQNREAQEEAATGPPFLWILSFGGAKESISPSGARTRLKKPSRQRLIATFFNIAKMTA